MEAEHDKSKNEVVSRECILKEVLKDWFCFSVIAGTVLRYCESRWLISVHVDLVGLASGVLDLKSLLGIDLDSVVSRSSGCCEPLVLDSDLEDVSSVVCGHQDWLGELLQVVLIGEVRALSVNPNIEVKQWI